MCDNIKTQTFSQTKHTLSCNFGPNGPTSSFFLLELVLLAVFLAVVRVRGFGVGVVAGGVHWV
jgi:hypothetical protein